MRFLHDIKKYQGLSLCYQTHASASALHDNSLYQAQPHSKMFQRYSRSFPN